jgi:hypothetical protein
VTSHVLSPTGEWLEFDRFDPAAVEAVKDLLNGGNACSTATTMTSTNECPGAACDGPGRGQSCEGGPAMKNDSPCARVEAESAP